MSTFRGAQLNATTLFSKQVNIIFQNRIEWVNVTNVHVYLWGQVARLTMGREKMFYLQKPKLLATLKGDGQPDLTSFCSQTYFVQHVGGKFVCSRLQIKYSCEVKNRCCQIRPTKIHSSMPNWCFFHQSDQEKTTQQLFLQPNRMCFQQAHTTSIPNLCGLE